MHAWNFHHIFHIIFSFLFFEITYLFSKILSLVIQKSIRAYLVSVFKNYFLLLKTKDTKNLFGEGAVFLFFVFSLFSKTIFLRTIKRCFHCFFTIQRINYFSCFLFFFFVFSYFFFFFFFLCFHKGGLHLTTIPSPANHFFFIKLLKLIYLHMVIKSSFV